MNDMVLNDLLEKYRDLKIDKATCLTNGGTDIFRNMDLNVAICNNHVIKLLEQYLNQIITSAIVFEWVNTIWFSDAFDYCDDGCDSIASVIARLEEFEESGEIPELVVLEMVKCLKLNKEYSEKM